MHHFKRPALAQKIAQELLTPSPLSDAANGLFLAAPRRTGKSEFLKLDLSPALEDLGVLVVYVDLWEDRTRAPMDLIAAKLAAAVNASLGVVAQATKKAGLSTIKVAGLEIDARQIGKTEGMTLHQVLALIHQQSGQRIALIIDEAQHALTSEAGEATMSALKSARDQMRTGAASALLLVFSGSHRDKLMRLLNTAAAPFYGSQVRALETLGPPFVDHVAQQLRVQTGAPVDADVLAQAFALCRQRPQFLTEALRQADAEPAPGQTLEQRALHFARQRWQGDRDGFAGSYRALGVLERAVLSRLLEKKGQFKPFDGPALGFYAEQTGAAVSAAQAQKALERLCKTEPPLVWRSVRGEYSLYDADMQDWHDLRRTSHDWPPR